MRTIKLNKGYEAKVDDEDFDVLNGFRWVALVCPHTVYAVRTEGKKIIRMHRQIMALRPNTDRKKQVDHLDHNGLNNQKSNLKVCRQKKNGRNRRIYGSSKYIGVMPVKSGRFMSQIVIKRKNKYLGTFDTEEHAAQAYNAAVKKAKLKHKTINKL